jgi:hypothetical protein
MKNQALMHDLEDSCMENALETLARNVAQWAGEPETKAESPLLAGFFV